MNTPVAEFAEHFVPLRDGLRMYCRDYGAVHAAATPVLCLPGLTRNSKDFESVAVWLSAGRRVLTPDLRGRGRSDRDPNWQNYQPLTYAQDVVQLLDALQVPRVMLIGTSLGGLIAMIMGLTASQRLAGVALNDIGPEVDPAGLARIAGYVGLLPAVTSWEEAVSQARLVNGVALPEFTDADWLRFARLTYREDEAGRPVLDMDPKIGDAARRVSGPAPDLWMLFGALQSLPLLVLRGETSDILSAATVAKMAQRKPDLQQVTVPRRGHAPTLDEPVAREALSAWLKRVP